MKERKTLVKTIILVLASCLLLAQEPPPKPLKPPLAEEEEFLPPERREPVEAIETIRLWRLTEELKLNEDQTAKLFPKLRGIREMREDFEKARLKKLGELAELLTKRVKPEELKKKITELKELEKKFREKEETIRKEIESILSPEQFARFLIFQEKFEGRIRRLLKDIREKRWRKR